MYDTLHNKGRIHCHIEGSKGSNLAATIDDQFFGRERPNHLTLTLYCNLERATHLIWNLFYHAKTKHIEARYHHIQELVTNKKLDVQKVDIKVNITNNLTKSLSGQR